jgi:hypothetical protein
MDENGEIDGGGPDQVPLLGEPSESISGSPREVQEQVDPIEIEEDELGTDDAANGFDEDYGDYAMDLSGSNAHRISPGPSESSAQPERSASVIPPVRNREVIRSTYQPFMCEPGVPRV